jgi:hypothetical protein
MAFPPETTIRASLVVQHKIILKQIRVQHKAKERGNSKDLEHETRHSLAVEGSDNEQKILVSIPRIAAE